MRFLNRAQALESSDLSAVHGFYGRDAGANRLSFDNHSASPALAKTATKFRSAEFKIIGKHIEKWGGGIDIQRMCAPINFQCNCTHIVPKVCPTAVCVK